MRQTDVLHWPPDFDAILLPYFIFSAIMTCFALASYILFVLYLRGCFRHLSLSLFRLIFIYSDVYYADFRPSLR